MKPAQLPSATRVNSVNDPACGSAIAISLSIRMINTMTRPASA